MLLLLLFGIDLGRLLLLLLLLWLLWECLLLVLEQKSCGGERVRKLRISRGLLLLLQLLLLLLLLLALLALRLCSRVARELVATGREQLLPTVAAVLLAAALGRRVRLARVRARRTGRGRNARASHRLGDRHSRRATHAIRAATATERGGQMVLPKVLVAAGASAQESTHAQATRHRLTAAHHQLLHGTLVVE